MDDSRRAKAVFEAQIAAGNFIRSLLDGSPSVWDNLYKCETLTAAYKAVEKNALEQYDVDDEVVAKRLSAWRAKHGY